MTAVATINPEITTPPPHIPDTQSHRCDTDNLDLVDVLSCLPLVLVGEHDQVRNGLISTALMRCPVPACGREFHSTLTIMEGQTEAELVPQIMAVADSAKV